MDTAEIFVVAGGLSLISFTLWFFFGQREEVAVAILGRQGDLRMPYASADYQYESCGQMLDLWYEIGPAR